MRYLLDTDHISILQKPSGREFSEVYRRFSQHKDDSHFSIINLHEQVIGVQAFLNKAKRPSELPRGYDLLEKVYQTYKEMPLLKFEGQCVEELEYLLSLNLRVGRMDLRLAATARAYDLVFVTRNRSDFERIPDLQIEDWTK